MHQTLRPMDAVLALGSNAPRVARHAADLFLQGYGKYLILAGGNGKDSIFTQPEAAVFATIARERGVPQDRLIIEDRSANTGENILFIGDLLAQKQLDLSSFLLVNKPYMERRSYATFRRQWPEAECIVASPNTTFEQYACNSEASDRLFHLLAGTLQRIKEYPSRGFQLPQEIPDDVWGAYTVLVDSGYTNYLIREA